MRRNTYKAEKRKLRLRHVMAEARHCVKCGSRFFPSQTVSGKSTEQHCGKPECTAQWVGRL